MPAARPNRRPVTSGTEDQWPPRDAALELRAARDTDSPGLVALVGRCFADYPGCVLDVNDEEPGLLTPTTSFARFWVVVAHDRVLASVACAEHDVDGVPGVELKKCYVHPVLRGRGWATRLVALVEDFAAAHERRRIELWSDTRFATAHAVYRHLGYRATGEQRELHDRSQTREYRFAKDLAAPHTS